MNTLSERAWRMLNESPRDLIEPKQPQTIPQIEAILRLDDCPTNHAIVPFQLELAGYTYKYLSLYVRLGMTDGPLIEYEDGHWLCEYADFINAEDTIQLMMDENGAIYSTLSPIPLASSVGLYLESVALEKELEKSTTPRVKVGGDWSIRILNKRLSVLGTRLEQLGFSEQKEVSDNYERWWFGSTGWVHAFTLMSNDDPMSAVILSTENVPHLEELAKAFDGLANFPPPSKYLLLPRK